MFYCPESPVWDGVPYAVACRAAGSPSANVEPGPDRRARWPQLASINFRQPGAFAYTDRRLRGGTTPPLCCLCYAAGPPASGLCYLPGRSQRIPELVLPSGHLTTPDRLTAATTG